MRALLRLRIPALLFVNKIDRAGAGEERVLRAIAARLSPAVVPMGSASGLGTRAAGFTPWGDADAGARARLAEILAERDEGILAAYVDDELGLPYARLRQELAVQTRRALVYPVFFGSAATGAGVPALMAGLTELLPTGMGDPGGPVSGQVFKIERGPGGEKLAYVRMFSGIIRTRDRLRFSASPEGSSREGKVTAISVFERGTATIRASVAAGQIAKLRGLDEIQIGDQVGEPRPGADQPQFAPPTLESVVAARRPADRAALRVALGQLAEQDPLINVRQSPGELAVSLYGEVQKEVIQATLAADFGIEVTFRETTTICIERPVGSGQAAELLGAPGNPFPVALGLRVDPAPPGSGVAFRLEVDVRSVPMYVYKTVGNFAAMMTRYITQALCEGLRGWQVTDCTVTMTESGYISPSTTAAHFRKLTPLVLMAALDQAGTAVCEPMIRVSLDIPAETTGAVLAAVARLGGTAGAPVPHRRSGCAAGTAAGGQGAGSSAAAARPDQRRGGGGNQLRRLPAGDRSAARPAADPGRPAQPRGVHDAARGPGDGRLGRAGRIEWCEMITRSALFRSWTWRPCSLAMPRGPEAPASPRWPGRSRRRAASTASSTSPATASRRTCWPG